MGRHKIGKVTIQLLTRLHGDDSLKQKIGLAVRHDYLLHSDSGAMKEESIYGWLSFLVYRRLDEIRGKK